MQAVVHILTSNLVLAVATLVGAVFGAWGLIATYRSRRRRVITYSFPVRKQLFFNQYVGYGGFDLRLNGRPVRDLFYLQLKIRYEGTEAIYKKDFLRPLELQFDKEVTVFPVSMKRQRSDIGINSAIETRAGVTIITFDTELIEPGDELLVDIIYESDGTPVYKVDGRLVAGELKGRSSDPANVRDDMRLIIWRRHKTNKKLITFGGFAVLIGVIKALLRVLFPTLDLQAVSSWITGGAFLLLFTAVMLAVNAIFDKKLFAELDEYSRTVKERRAILEGPAGKLTSGE